MISLTALSTCRANWNGLGACFWRFFGGSELDAEGGAGDAEAEDEEEEDEGDATSAESSSPSPSTEMRSAGASLKNMASAELDSGAESEGEERANIEGGNCEEATRGRLDLRSGVDMAE